MPKHYSVIGLMSGTSMDGLDIAYVEFTLQNEKWSYNLLNTGSVLYNDFWRQQLASAINMNQAELIALNKSYGNWLGEQVRRFIQSASIEPDLIASHGHTVIHQPDRGITLQIGDGQAIAALTGIKTICDFRSLDVELGGQGAPLVPIGDKLLFDQYLACLNLGGIANISYEKDGKRRAFDIGMANMPLNYFAREMGLQYDEDGAIAAHGKCHKDLFAGLNRLTFYDQPPPKSLGLEWFLQEMLPLVNSFEITIEDKLATLVKHEAYQIGRAITAIGAAGNILVTGGGAHNKHFLESITHEISDEQSIVLPDRELIDYKEALIFALMGVLRLNGQINSLKSVTGATRDSSSGQLFKPTAI